MKRQILELTLEKLSLEVTGARKNANSVHVVTVGLIWPRPAIAEKLAVKVLDVAGKSCSLARKPWVERILFKETVEGPFGVELTVSEPVSDRQVADFMRFMGSAMFKLAASEVADLVVNPLAGALTGTPLRYLSKEISSSGKKAPRIIAAGSVDLRAEDLVRHGKNSPVKLRLRTEEGVHSVVRTRKHGKSSVRKTTLLEAGQPNGEAVLGARLY
ncbi:hypothetical protein ACFLQU_02515 [Verrucomicrobiota bacterium]